MKTGTLCSCKYGCKYVWVEKNYKAPYSTSFPTVCPKCGRSPILVTNAVNVIPIPIVDNVTKLTVTTFAKEAEAYSADLILKKLAEKGFVAQLPVINRYDYYNVTYLNTNNDFVLFICYTNRKTTDLYVGLQGQDPSLIEELKTLQKEQARLNKINAAKKPIKPIYATMKDALGYDVTIGDWVVQWSSKSLTFGKIKKIDKIQIQSWRSSSDFVFAAKIVSQNNILSPFKTSNQIMLISPEKALLLMLEK